ncbi:amino acid ABC transporter substrate-binding protein/permease [Tessaracoccus sp. MC1679]|uniref:amino acid ABC transporter substrate-binding protein/permease n=1 Tax=Tessaracoccus sp. MC1679 TaxID=2760313 RepID=UPI00351C386D
MRSLNLSGHVRRLSAAVAVLMIGGFLAAPVAQAAPSPNPDVVGKTFAIATDTTFAPFEFRDTSGELTGIDMDLIREVAERGGFTVDIKSVGFDAALQSLQSGQVAGVIAGMSITDERRQTFDFSDPYFESGIQMAVKQDSTIASYEDLRDQTVVAKTGSEGLRFAQSIAGEYGFTVKALPQADTMYSEVNAGTAAAVFDDYPVLAYGIKQGNGLKTVTAKEPGGSYGFAVSKGQNGALLAEFNAQLAAMKEDGTYQQILDEYLDDGGGGAGGEPASGIDPLVAGKTYAIATDTTFAPFEFRDASGELTGIDIDLLYAIAERKGFEVDVKSVGFDAALQALQSNQVAGVIAGMSITDERREIFDFSDPYFDSGIQMAVKGDSAIATYEDLEGETVVAKTGSEGLAFAESIKDQYGFTVKALPQADTMYSEVNAGTAAAVFDDYPVLAYGIKQGNGLKAVTPKEPGGQYGFAVNKGMNPELLAAFNAGLAEMKADGSYQAVLDTYLQAPTETGRLGFIDLLVTSLPALSKGMLMTIAATALSLLFALILGLVLGFFKVGGNAVLNAIASVYVDIFRGTPLLVQAFFIYFGLPTLTGVKLDVLVAGILTLALNAGAYMTEIVRGGIQSVDPGQLEAARSLGLPWMTSMKKVVVPQAVKIMTPSFINQFVITLKDTSLLAVLGLAELTYQGQQIIANNFRSAEIWLIVGALYLIVIKALTMLSNAVDRRFNK